MYPPGPIRETGKGSAIVSIDDVFPTYLRGWNQRGWNWEGRVGVRQEFLPGLSASADVIRHWYGNFLVNDNLLVAPTDYSSFCVTAPVDDRLPGGGGNAICGHYNLNPNRVGQVQNVVTAAAKYGNVSDVFTGFDLAANLRLRRITLQGGVGTGHEVVDNCDVAAMTDSATNAQVAPSLGRNLSAGATVVSVPLVAPGTLFGKRINQVDVRVAKTFTLKRARIQALVDAYNVFNVSTILAYNTTYGVNWLRPTRIMPGRFIKLGVQANF